MKPPELLRKVALNAVTVFLSYWVVDWMLAGGANPELFFGIWAGMSYTHAEYLGYSRRGGR